MATVVTPLYDRILVKRVEAATHTTEAGLFIPEAARERPQEGVVIAVGAGRPVPNLASYDDRTGEYAMPCARGWVRVGDRVVIGKYAGAEIRVGLEEYLILREDEVLAVVTTVETEAL